MHTEAKQYVARFATYDDGVVYELGSLDINGSVRDLFPKATYVGVDQRDVRGVDVVADATQWTTKAKADIVVSCEVLEHCEDWPALISNAHRLLKKGGQLILTAAGPDRKPHSGYDGGPLRDDEYYANIREDDLLNILEYAGFGNIEVDVLGADIRAVAEKV